MVMTMEDFQRWHDNPVSQWVFAAAEKAALAQSEAWMADSWGRGESDPVKLTELRTRADAYRALFETPFERWAELHGDTE
jgi:hypothetical protein